MSEHDDLDLGPPRETEGQDNRDPLPDDPRPKGAAGPQTSKELSCFARDHSPDPAGGAD
jgi:hypothetical protein